MGLLALELQVDAVGKTPVEQLDCLTPARLWQVVLRGMEPVPAGAGAG
jgi:hypothetical protein